MSCGVVRVIASFFRKGQDTPIERHRSRVPIDSVKQSSVVELKRHLTEFLGLKELTLKYGIGGFAVKLFRLAKSSSGKCENFAIVTDAQWQLELVSLLADESTSELNDK